MNELERAIGAWKKKPGKRGFLGVIEAIAHQRISARVSRSLKIPIRTIYNWRGHEKSPPLWVQTMFINWLDQNKEDLLKDKEE